VGVSSLIKMLVLTMLVLTNQVTKSQKQGTTMSRNARLHAAQAHTATLRTALQQLSRRFLAWLLLLLLVVLLDALRQLLQNLSHHRWACGSGQPLCSCQCTCCSVCGYRVHVIAIAPPSQRLQRHTLGLTLQHQAP
jgi:hypothetical protein